MPTTAPLGPTISASSIHTSPAPEPRSTTRMPEEMPASAKQPLRHWPHNLSLLCEACIFLTRTAQRILFVCRSHWDHDLTITVRLLCSTSFEISYGPRLT